MALKPLAELDDFELVNSDQDCRGWPVTDASGQRIGTVSEMLVDTETEHVTTLVLDSGAEVPARTVSFRDGSVIVNQVQGNEVGRGISDSAEREGVVLPVVEEKIRVGKREVDSGGVRVTTRVEEQPVQESVDLRSEQVQVKRRPVDRPAGETAFKEGTLEVDTRSEEAVVDKQARVVEEVEVTKQVTEHQEDVRGTVRNTEVDVERVEPGRKDTRRTGR